MSAQMVRIKEILKIFQKALTLIKIRDIIITQNKLIRLPYESCGGSSYISEYKPSIIKWWLWKSELA